MVDSHLQPSWQTSLLLLERKIVQAAQRSPVVYINTQLILGRKAVYQLNIIYIIVLTTIASITQNTTKPKNQILGVSLKLLNHQNANTKYTSATKLQWITNKGLSLTSHRPPSSQQFFLQDKERNKGKEYRDRLANYNLRTGVSVTEGGVLSAFSCCYCSKSAITTIQIRRMRLRATDTQKENIPFKSTFGIIGVFMIATRTTFLFFIFQQTEIFKPHIILVLLNKHSQFHGRLYISNIH